MSEKTNDTDVKDTDKDTAKQKVESFLKEKGLVGVVYGEKSGIVMGVDETGTPKLINQNDAYYIISQMGKISPNRCSYALNDNNKDKDVDPAQVDTIKEGEIKEKSENIKENKSEVQQRIDEARKRIKEERKEPDALESSLNKLLGKNPDNLKKDLLGGIVPPKLHEICKKVASRAAENIGKQAVKVLNNSLGKNKGKGRP